MFGYCILGATPGLYDVSNQTMIRHPWTSKQMLFCPSSDIQECWRRSASGKWATLSGYDSIFLLKGNSSYDHKSFLNKNIPPFANMMYTATVPGGSLIPFWGIWATLGCPKKTQLFPDPSAQLTNSSPWCH